MKSRSGLTLVEATIVLAMILLLAAISLPAFFKNQDQKREAACVRNLDAIATACRRFAAERGGFPKSLAHLVPDYLPAAPACPAGGTYTLGTPEGDPPACSLPGHRL